MNVDLVGPGRGMTHPGPDLRWPPPPPPKLKFMPPALPPPQPNLGTDLGFGVCGISATSKSTNVRICMHNMKIHVFNIMCVYMHLYVYTCIYVHV